MNGTPAMTKPTPAPQCPQCGTPLTAGAVAGLCPACLLKLGTTQDSVTGPKRSPFIPPTAAELAPAFPQLDVLELIGKGGMGAVYKARQKQLDRVVALKILPPGIGAGEAFAARFTREAQALARLNHPGIVTLYEFGQVPAPRGGGSDVAPPSPSGERSPGSSEGAERGRLCYFLMEFVDGVNLRQLLHPGRLSAREALAIVPQICDALQYAHDQGIVHRDIKPENILLDRRGRVKVADFGLAKIVGSQAPAASSISPPAGERVTKPCREALELTDADKVLGTPSYMAPEQMERPTDVDHRADIYALGVVFYQMLTGELPGSPLEPPSRKIQVDVRLDEVVLRALERQPELRYQQASVLKTEVETLASRMGSVASEGQTGSAPARPEGSRPWLAGSIALTYAGTFLFGLLCELLRGSAPGGWLLGAFGLLAGVTLVASWLITRRAPTEVQRMVFRTAAWVAFVTALPTIGFAVFFLIALIQERGGWHPALAEAVLVPLVWLGAVLLPVCGGRLWRAGLPQGGRARAGAGGSEAALPDPLPALDFWQALESGDYSRAWDRGAIGLQRDVAKDAWVSRLEQARRPFGRAIARQTLEVTFLTPQTRFQQRVLTEFESGKKAAETVVCALQPDGAWKVERYHIEPAAPVDEPSLRPMLRRSPAAAGLAVAALLLLTASGNAVAMLAGSALLLALGLIWYGRRAWRVALLVALASFGVATAAVGLLLKVWPPGLERSPQPTASATDAAWTDAIRLRQVFGLGSHGSASGGDDAFRYEVVFDERSVALTVGYRKEKDLPYRVQFEDRRGRRRLLAEGGSTLNARSAGSHELVEEKKMLTRAEFERVAALILQRRTAATSE